MPWFAWIAITAIIVFGISQVISMTGNSSSGEDELEELRERVKALEKERPRELEEPRIPTKGEENLAAEDRWRLDMLEARLQHLERTAEPQESGQEAFRRDDGISPAQQNDAGDAGDQGDDGNHRGEGSST